MSLSIQHLFLWVELIPHEKERTTASGLLLPDSWWSKQDSTALVLGVGNGLPLDGGGVVRPQCEPGDVILLEYGDFRQVEKAQGTQGERGFIWEPSVIGWLDTVANRPIPANDYVLVELDERPKQEGSVLLTDRAERPRSGIVKEVGPGRLITRGENRGRRLSVETLCGSDVVGRRVYWNKTADVICAGHTRLEWVLLKAGDLMVSEGKRIGVALHDAAKDGPVWVALDGVTT